MNLRSNSDTFFLLFFYCLVVAGCLFLFSISAAGDFKSVSDIIGTLIFLVAAIGTMVCSDSNARRGWHLFPRSINEGKGIVLRGFQLLFIVSLILFAYPVSVEITKVLMTSSFFGMLLCGIAFWKSNRSQAIYGFALILLAFLMALLYPAISA